MDSKSRVMNESDMEINIPDTAAFSSEEVNNSIEFSRTQITYESEESNAALETSSTPQFHVISSNTTQLEEHNAVSTVINDSNINSNVRESEEQNNPSAAFADGFQESSSASTADTSESSLEQVIMAITWQKGKLGAASYSTSTSEITVLNDIVDINPDFFMTKTLFCQVQPNELITSKNVGVKFLSTLNFLMSADTTDQDESREDGKITLNEKLHLLNSKECNYEVCKRRVLDVQLPNDPYKVGDDGHIAFMEFILKLSNQSMVIALGMLLKYLDRNWMTMNLDNNQITPPILLINNIYLDKIVTIDAETYEALQVFSRRLHPSQFKMWTPGSNSEGLSIYSIVNRCKSKLGSNFMRKLLLTPTRDLKLLNERLDAVQFLQQAESIELVKNLLDCIRKIKNITAIVTKLMNSHATLSDWKSLYATLYHSITLHSLCVKFADKTPIFSKIASCSTSSLYKVIYVISQIIDFPQSLNNRPVVKLGLDAELDCKKQEYANLQSVLTAVAGLELPHLPAYVEQCSVLYIPEVGFLTAIPFWKSAMKEKDLHIEGLEFVFATDGIAHYKTPRCRQLDTRLGDTQLEILTMEARIIYKLTEYTCENISSLHSIVQLVAELDCLIALSIVAKEHGYCRPHLTKGKELKIVNGRHPLQELCVDSFVQNDTLSSESDGLMKILTGPNASGKSVYLKQVALIAYLAHVGSFVPASSATIGVLDCIHTRIQTEESIAVNLSAFLIDLKQMSTSLFWSTQSSLIIIDEFGKGTDEVSGLSLLVASLKHFLSRGKHCPHVFVSTHFHRVVDMLGSSELLKFQTMEYVLDEENQLVYLFRIIDGSSHQGSLALKVAESLGVSPTVIERSKQVLRAIRSGEDVPPCENKQTIQQEKYVAFAKKYLRQGSLDVSDEEYQKMLVELEKLRAVQE